MHHGHPHHEHHKHPHKLHTDGVLSSGQSLRSENGQYFAVMQDDGNLVVYQGTNHAPEHAIWASNTNQKGQGPHRVVM